MIGPQTRLGQEVHSEKHSLPGEDFRESQNRVAGALCEDHDHYIRFRDVLLEQEFLPGGRIQSSIGSPKATTAFNCYVSGTIEDSFVHGAGSIMARAVEAATTMRMGGGIGYDFSTLRPKGALIKKLGSRSSGPLAFMDIYDAVCGCVQSAGHRRGAQMGVLRVDHPDIIDFIHAKQNETRLTKFNISVAVTDEFMKAVSADSEFTLRWGGQAHGSVRARSLWDMLMRATYDWAEPGVIFIDRINRLNNLRYCERIAATNPCGEQPLPPHGACLLGSTNLAKLVRRGDGRWLMDETWFERRMPDIVRAMDAVIDNTRYPLDEQEVEAKAKRRMGLGVTGLANAVEAVLGRPSYGDPEFLLIMESLLKSQAEAAYRASVQLARELGPFPAFDPAQYLAAGTFASTLPADIQSDIRTHGIRNSHLLSIAPAGTISLGADNVSSGIEPVFSLSYQRTINMPEGVREERVEDYGHRVFGVAGRVSDQVTVDQHLAVLAIASKWVDSAVSKTCNVPKDIPFVAFKELYLRAWRLGAKGCTTFRKGGQRGGILSDAIQPSSCQIDPVTGRRDCA